ncbi:MAG: hypothetical protein EXS17_05415 [Phycisphaerales bacterium]|nr:hypothetical protein [Phycisphaerales bacterium]
MSAMGYPDDELKDNDPTDEDVRRFSAPVVARCPDCGAAVIEEAEICPKCHAFLWDGPAPRESAPRRGVRFVAIALILLVILSLTGLIAIVLR